MITLKRLNGANIVVNAELIECLESHGAETVIILATGNRYVVAESVEEVTDKAMAYRKKINSEQKVVNPIRGYERSNP